MPVFLERLLFLSIEQSVEVQEFNGQPLQMHLMSVKFLSLVAEYNGRPAFTPTRYSNLIGLANTFRDLSIVIHALLHAHVAADNQQHISRNVYIDDDNELKAVFSVPRKRATTNKANLNIIVKTHTLADRKEHNALSHNGHYS